MQKPKEIAELSLDLWYLPLAQVAQVRELVQELMEKHGYDRPTDDSDEWTEEDMREATIASMRRFDEEHPGEDWSELPAPRGDNK
jgi:hypothetical protein